MSVCMNQIGAGIYRIKLQKSRIKYIHTLRDILDMDLILMYHIHFSVLILQHILQAPETGTQLVLQFQHSQKRKFSLSRNLRYQNLIAVGIYYYQVGWRLALLLINERPVFADPKTENHATCRIKKTNICPGTGNWIHQYPFRQQL